MHVINVREPGKASLLVPPVWPVWRFAAAIAGDTSIAGAFTPATFTDR